MKTKSIGWIAALAVVLTGCSKDTTVDSTAAVCAQGQYSCKGDELRVCNDVGSGWDIVETCSPGQCLQGRSRCEGDEDGGVGGTAGAGAGGGGGSAGTGAGAGGESGSAGAGGESGSAGAAGVSGSSGVGGAGGTAGANTCGTPTGGPTLVELPEGYCIDATEVTRAQYEVWLLTNPSTTGQEAACSWNSDFTPDTTTSSAGCGNDAWPPGTQGDHPVVCVDWCDAKAYCASVGKRLCGNIGGGSNGFGNFANATTSQWFVACTSGGKKVLPYGDVYEGATCNGTDANHEATLTVANLAGCQSSVAGYEGVYDLSGNASEWEDSCDGASSESDDCRIRGGSFFDGVSELHCNSDEKVVRSYRSHRIGFRCCSSP